jgi:hypothetical protein
MGLILYSPRKSTVVVKPVRPVKPVEIVKVVEVVRRKKIIKKTPACA